MADRVLVTGATGKTGGALVRRLRGLGVEVRAGTRRPVHPGDVRFDWRDRGTFGPALAGVDGVYLVAPTDTSAPLVEMRPFLERAVASEGCEGGVAGRRREPRLVLLSASALPAGGPMMGAVHAWLAAHARDWAALRPSWFMQNFATQHLDGIRRDGAVCSATADGRVPFIDAEDIAAVAAALLTEPAEIAGVAPVLTGPRALSYDEAAEAISEVAGRSIRHVRLGVGELARRHEGFGLPADSARLLAEMDGRIAEGAEDRTTDEVERWTGRPPNDLRSFLASQRGLFGN